MGFDSAKLTSFRPPGSGRSDSTGAFASATSPERTRKRSRHGTLAWGSSKQGITRRASIGSKKV